MNSVVIRKANKTDVGRMLELIKELAEFEHGLNEVTMNEKSLLENGFSEHPIFHCLIAEEENQILGTL